MYLIVHMYIVYIIKEEVRNLRNCLHGKRAGVESRVDMV